MQTEYWCLGAPGAKTKSAFRHGVVFFRLQVAYFRFPLCNSFSREDRNNLAHSMEINTLERALVEAFSNRFPRFTAAHERAQVSVSVRS